MILAADVGNTNIQLGFFEGETLISERRISNEKIGEIEDQWVDFSSDRGVDRLDAVVVASVNPKTKIPLCHWVRKTFGFQPLVVKENLVLDMPLLVDNPEEVGADRIVNAYATYRAFGEASIVVDFGTAITFDIISERGEYMGGLITVGLNTAAWALSHQTALLPYIQVRACDELIGRNTVDSMNAGLYWGTIGLVSSVLDYLTRRLKRKPKIVATGGDAPLIAAKVRQIEEVMPHLTLVGLRLAYEQHRKGA